MARILLIEDDDQYRTMLRIVVERRGHEVRVARNGREGLALMDATIDLVITDIVMPEKEGFETIMDLRRLFRDTPIIAMSGGGKVGPDEYLHTAQILGAQRTLRKPFTNGALHAAIDSLLRQPLTTAPQGTDATPA